MRSLIPASILHALLLVLLLAGCSNGALPRVEGLPDTPAGVVLAEWLHAYNTADADAMAAFTDRRGTVEPPADTQASRSRTGAFDLLEVEHATASDIRVRVRQQDDLEEQRIHVAVSAGPQPRLATLRREPLPPGRMDDEGAWAAAVGARARALADEGRFSGAWLLGRHGQVVAQGAAGVADRTAGVPVTADTQFRFGSAGKMFVAVSVMQLVEAGVLSLEQPVGTWLPDYPSRAIARSVTLRHLLTHSGGVGDIFGPQFEARRDTLRTHGDYIALYGARAPEFAPGSETRYSNYGFVLAAAVVEAVTGRDWYDVVDERVFAPAGMHSTGYAPEDASVPGRARPYTWRDGAWVDAADTLPWRGTAAGGGYTTVGDLQRFANALHDGRLVSQASLAVLTSPNAPGAAYGLGFAVSAGDPPRRFGHGGGAPGMNAAFRVFPDSGHVLAVLTNQDHPSAVRLLRFAEQRMPLSADRARHGD